MKKAIISLFTFIFSITVALSANFAPVQDGNFNSGSTWGTASPPGSTDHINYAYWDWTNLTRNITLTQNEEVRNVTLNGDNLTFVLKASSPYTLTINNLTVSNNVTFIIQNNVSLVINGNTSFSSSSFIIQNNASLVVNGTTLFKEVNFLVKDEASTVFNSNVTNSGDGVNMNIEELASVDINATFTITGGISKIELFGIMETNYLSASGGSQEINVYQDGILTVKNDAIFDGSAGFDIKNLGSVNILGNLTMDGGTTGNVDGTLDVDGTLTVPNYDNPLTLTVTDNGTLIAGNINGSGVGGSGEIINESTLPITLKYFRGSSNMKINNIQWQTTSETNNDYFLLEESFDTKSWSTLTTIKGSGNSSTPKNYTYVTPAKAITVYYKLTQFDYNGDSETFKYIAVTNNQLLSDNLLTNDFTGYTISYFSINGQLIFKQNNKFSTLNIPKGIYLVSFQNENQQFCIKYQKN